MLQLYRNCVNVPSPFHFSRISMAKPSDREYTLQRKIKDLEQRNQKLEEQLVQLRKKLEKMEQPVEPKAKKKAPSLDPVCPLCSAPVLVTVLPFGKMKICSAACGFRNVTKNE